MKASSDEADGINIRFPKVGLGKWVQKNKKKELGVWNVSSKKQIQRDHQLKIKFITTDDPLLCIETLTPRLSLLKSLEFFLIFKFYQTLK